MRTIHSTVPHAVAVVALSALSMALAGCNRHADDPAPTPATVVMPGSAAPDAATAAASGTSIPPNSAVPTGSASDSTSVPAAPSTGLTGGTVTVLPGTAPATSSSAGLPASATELPTPGVIGPASAPASDQPPSVAPGTTR